MAASLLDRQNEEAQAAAARASAETAGNDRNRVETEGDKLARQNELDREAANAKDASEESLVDKWTAKNKQEILLEKETVVVVGGAKKDTPAAAPDSPPPAQEQPAPAFAAAKEEATGTQSAFAGLLDGINPKSLTLGSGALSVDVGNVGNLSIAGMDTPPTPTLTAHQSQGGARLGQDMTTNPAARKKPQ